jgi:ClpX C4-type zinc finger
VVSTVLDYEVEIGEQEVEALPEESPEEPLRCSFCCQPHDRVSHMFRSPVNLEATICGECLLYAHFLVRMRSVLGRFESRYEDQWERGLRGSFCNKQ